MTLIKWHNSFLLNLDSSNSCDSPECDGWSYKLFLDQSISAKLTKGCLNEDLVSLGSNSLPPLCIDWMREDDKMHQLL